MTLWHLTKKLQPFALEIFGDVFKTSFSHVHGINWWKKREKCWACLSVSKIEPLVFGLMTNVFLRGSQYCFLLAHRKTLMKENVLLKKLFYFFSILLFWTLSENIWPFLSKTFRLICQNCNLRDLKHVVENHLFSKNIFSLSSSFISVRDGTKPIGVSAKKLTVLSNCILCTKRNVFLRKKNFLEKTCFLTVWDMGQKKYGLLSIFFPPLCRNFLLLVHTSICLTLFGNLHHFLWLCDTWQKNFSLSPRNILAMLSKLHFHMFTGLTGEKKGENFALFYQCRWLRHKFLAFWQNFSRWVVSTAFYLLIGRLWWRANFFWKGYYTFLAFLLFRTLSENIWPFCRKLSVWFVKTAIFVT